MENISHDGNEIISELVNDIGGFVNFIESRLVEARGRIEAEDYGFDLSPFNGLTSITTFTKNYEDFFTIANRWCDWYSEFHDYHRHELYQLFKPLKSLRGTDKKLWLLQAIEDALNEKEFTKALLLAEQLQLNQESFPILIRISEVGVAEERIQDVKQLLSHFTLPKDGWRAGVGEAPPEMVRLKATFKSMKEMVSNAEISRIIEKCIDSVQKQIDAKLRQDDEEF